MDKAEKLRAELPAASVVEPAAARAKALGDPTRLMLARTDELCVCDLAWIGGRAENLVSYHLRALRSARLVTSRRDGKMVLYALAESGHALLRALEAEAIT